MELKILLMHVLKKELNGFFFHLHLMFISRHKKKSTVAKVTPPRNFSRNERTTVLGRPQLPGRLFWGVLRRQACVYGYGCGVC